MKKYNGYKSWTEYLNNTPTDPIQNYDVCGYVGGIYHEINKLRLPKESIVKFHQRILGKQKFCWQTYEKMYIWETETYRLFVGKNKGWLLEVFMPADKEKTEKALINYLKSLGIDKCLEHIKSDYNTFLEQYRT